MSAAMKKVPQRMCVTCRERRNKKELIRIVLMPDGLVCVDPTGKKPGRGVYTCKNKECLQKAIKSHRIEKGLKSEVSSDVIDLLYEQAVQIAQEE
jgi:predicted RNA-binding protein YlxR (DUF448 family)